MKHSMFYIYYLDKNIFRLFSFLDQVHRCESEVMPWHRVENYANISIIVIVRIWQLCFLAAFMNLMIKSTGKKKATGNLSFFLRLSTLAQLSLRKKCPYSESFWSAFSRIWTEYEEIRSISPYTVRMRGNADQNNSEYGHFSHSVSLLLKQVSNLSCTVFCKTSSEQSRRDVYSEERFLFG